MKIANIYPVKNQELYKEETYVMILAHLMKKGLYKRENFSDKQYIICDNGLYEESQVSTNLQSLIDLIESSNIPVNEIIVPDVVNDLKATIKLFEENLETIKKYQSKYTFMFVAQSTTYEELKEAIEYINGFDLNLSIGISKLTPLDRASKEAITIYKTALHPIHLLGLKTSFSELVGLENIVRGCDSSQLAYFVKNSFSDQPTIDVDFLKYERSGRREDGRGIEGIDVDLEHDHLNSAELRVTRALLPSFLTTTEKYQEFVIDGASPKYDKKLAVIGLIGEVGELADVIKKETIYEDMSKFEEKYGMSVREKAKDELGDVLWQFTLLFSMYGLDLNEIIRSNISKLMKRHGGIKTSKDGGSR